MARLEDFARNAKGAVSMLFAYVPAEADESPSHPPDAVNSDGLMAEMKANCSST